MGNLVRADVFPGPAARRVGPAAGRGGLSVHPTGERAPATRAMPRLRMATPSAQLVAQE
jgi:hypothetical protein